jgi:hypothetical protein
MKIPSKIDSKITKQRSKIKDLDYIKACENIKKNLHFQLIEDTIVLCKDKNYHPSISTGQGNQLVYQLPPAP